jgi:MoxR-like ATPase
MALVRCSKTWAAAAGRTYVSPDDIKALALPVIGHRLLLTPDAEFSGVKVGQVVGKILGDIAAPSERGAA